MDFCPSCRRIYFEQYDHCSADGTATVAITPQHDPLIGLVFDDRYKLIRKLGAGGNGVVYVAQQVGLKRIVAFKMMYAERMRDERALRRFAREARALAALDHPGCVRVLDYRAPDDSVPYLVMELVEGHPLLRVARAGAIPPRHAVMIARKMAEAAAAAHRAGIVHRDLKPENVILDLRDGELSLRLIDFGLALIAEDGTGGSDAGGGRLTRTGRVIGTPEYMSPEQVRGADADGRTDIYSIGIVLYELLTGRPPFSSANPTTTLSEQLTEPPPPLKIPSLSDERRAAVEWVVQSLLRKKPEDRPAEATYVARMLADLETRLPDAGSAADLISMADPLSVEGVDTDLLLTADADGAELIDDVLEEVRPRGPSLFDASARTATAPKNGDEDRRRPLWPWLLGFGGLAVIGAGVLAVTLASMGGADTELQVEARGVEFPDAALRQVVLAEEPVDVDDGLPTAGTIGVPGGQAQQEYEGELRALSARLSTQGLRTRDLRANPRAARAWSAQARHAREGNYGSAVASLGEVRSVASTMSARDWMILRLQSVERRGAVRGPEEQATLRALWATVDTSASSPGAVRRFMQRVDGLER